MGAVGLIFHRWSTKQFNLAPVVLLHCICNRRVDNPILPACPRDMHIVSRVHRTHNYETRKEAAKPIEVPHMKMLVAQRPPSSYVITENNKLTYLVYLVCRSGFIYDDDCCNFHDGICHDIHIFSHDCQSDVTSESQQTTVENNSMQQINKSQSDYIVCDLEKFSKAQQKCTHLLDYVHFPHELAHDSSNMANSSLYITWR